MSIWIIIGALVAGILGIIGSVLPILPGPPISWLGLLLLYLGHATRGEDPMSLTFLLIWAGIAAVVTVVDYFVPSYFTKLAGGSKAAGTGALLGMLAGIFLTPIGMILGAFLGAFLAELLVAKKNAGDAIVAALGSFMGFIFGTGMKLATTGIMMYYIVVYIF